MPLKTLPWDVIDHLTSDEVVAACLDACLEDGDPKLVGAALSDIARHAYGNARRSAVLLGQPADIADPVAFVVSGRPRILRRLSRGSISRANVPTLSCRAAGTSRQPGHSTRAVQASRGT